MTTSGRRRRWRTSSPKQPQTVPTLVDRGAMGSRGHLRRGRRVRSDQAARHATGSITSCSGRGIMGNGRVTDRRSGRSTSIADTARWFREKVLLPFLDAQLKPGAPAPICRRCSPIRPAATAGSGCRIGPPLPADAEALSASGWRPVLFRAGRRRARQLRLRSGQADPLSHPPDPADLCRRIDVAQLARRRSTPVFRSYRRADLRNTGARSAGVDRRRAGCRSDRLHHRQRRRFRGQADRRLSRANIRTSPNSAAISWRCRWTSCAGVTAPAFPRRSRSRPACRSAYKFVLPNVDHTFLPGHRIMVQIQSSWFPLYDRNPQTYVPNIFDAPADAYRKATITVFYDPAHASAIDLPVVPAPQ